MGQEGRKDIGKRQRIVCPESTALKFRVGGGRIRKGDLKERTAFLHMQRGFLQNMLQKL